MSVVSAEKLRALREAKGWDQSTLAQVAGVYPSVVSRLERGLQDDLTASKLVALARALEVAVDALLTTPHEQPEAPEPDLVAAISRVNRLSPAHQRQAAAILRAYILAMPDES